MASDDRSRRPNEPANGDDAPSTTDFGSFVSSSVRDSFRKLKPDSPPAPAATTPQPSTTARRSRRHSEPAGTEEAPDVPASQLGTPVGRKWRDALPGGAARNRETSTIPPESTTGESGSGTTLETDGGGFDAGAWFRTTFYDENGPNRKFWAMVAAVIVIILLVIYLSTLGGDDSTGDQTPTPTSTTVVSTDHTATPSRVVRPSATKTVTVVVKEPVKTTAPTPTPPVEEGGDNVRG
jgi:hypothetical protein